MTVEHGDEVVTVSEAAKRQIIYCSRRKIGTEREWDRTGVAKHVRHVTHVSNAIGIRNPPTTRARTRRAYKMRHPDRSIPKLYHNRHVTHSPSRSARARARARLCVRVCVCVSLVCSKAGASICAYSRFANRDSQFVMMQTICSLRVNYLHCLRFVVN